MIHTWAGHPHWFSQSSRFFTNPFKMPNPADDEAGALEILGALGRDWQAQHGKDSRMLALPSSDTALVFFLRHEETLRPYFTMMGDGAYNSFRADIAHKGRFFAQLQAKHPELMPVTFSCSMPGDIEAAVRGVPYPAIIKPAVKDYSQSFYRMNKGVKVVTVQDPTTLRAELTRLLGLGYELVVQERIDFDSDSDEIPFYAYADARHSVRVAATGIKELIQPERYGTANILKLSWHPDLLPLAQKITAAIGWRGMLMIEFIKDKKDGQWKVIEVNTRPWLFHDFYRQCGLPFTPYAIQDYLSELPDGPIITPTIGDTPPIHVDLYGMMKHFTAAGKTFSESALFSLVTRHSPHFSLAQGNAQDPGPVQQMFRVMESEFGLNAEKMQKLFFPRS